jgi:hypothetical protein
LREIERDECSMGKLDSSQRLRRTVAPRSFPTIHESEGWMYRAAQLDARTKAANRQGSTVERRCVGVVVVATSRHKQAHTKRSKFRRGVRSWKSYGTYLVMQCGSFSFYLVINSGKYSSP